MAKRIINRTPRDLVLEVVESAGIDGAPFTGIETKCRITYAQAEKTISELEAEGIIEGNRLDGYRLSVGEFARRLDALRKSGASLRSFKKNAAALLGGAKS